MPRFYDRSRRVNLLLPQAYDAAWTSRGGIFDGSNLPPGDIVANTAAGSTGGVGPNSAGQVMPENPARACLILKNTSASGGPVLWYAFGQIAIPSTQGSFSLEPGEGLVIANPDSCPKEAIYVAWSGAGAELGAWYQNSLPQRRRAVGVTQGWQANVGVQAGYVPQSSIAPGTEINGGTAASGTSGGGFVAAG